MEAPWSLGSFVTALATPFPDLLAPSNGPPSAPRSGDAAVVGARGVAVAGLTAVVGGNLAAYHAIFESSG